ncbi:fungal-specific transcription factor domain-containing protein [Fusarium tricinctum]|uniref:Fungal-specific transcription factor domain-containing protein n=1 Tax=Fusarium tricinctum TaxID=61284 RepID=A0A8K0SAK7_9HYPO|nr:fungal-specific transcription factor domain-containing protein [Fusarium tricinctum]
MFHMFQGQVLSEATPTAVSTQQPPRKINRSCSECTRRKVRCDGGYPCASCQYYQVPQDCVYRQRSIRQTTSKSAIRQATDTVRRQAGVLELLFPNCSLDELIGKNRDELFSLLSLDTQDCERFELQGDQAQAVISPTISGELEEAHESSSDELESEESGQGRHWNEPAQNPRTVAASDDINAINLAGGKHRRSYLGVTSVSAVLKALFRLCPAAKVHTVEQSKTWPEVQAEDSLSFLPNPSYNALPTPNWLREQRHIGFYFEHIHAITPLLNEDSFRTTFTAGTRQARSWLGLRNMVLALGSIASGSDSTHIQYYSQARQFLDFDSLGTGNLETLQSLCLLGGYYLHYRNSPNMAYAILGAAQRLAIALGLHRESSARVDDQDPEANQRHLVRLETRRRVWWSLYCLDTWASMTFGRPTCGRRDTSTWNTALPSAFNLEDYAAVSLKASVQFCHIGNRIQHRFALSTRISIEEAQGFDRELQDWYDSLPPIIKDTNNTPPRITVAREFLRNRYYNVRLILSRCFLLYLAYEDTKKHPLGQSELQMAEMCGNIATEAIDAIAIHWVPNRIQAWNSAWYLFQACTVPLLSLAIGSSLKLGGTETDPLEACHTNLNKALEIFSEMKPWMRASDRAPDMVAVLFQAVSENAEGIRRTPSLSDGGLHLFGWADEQLIDIDWSALLAEDMMSQNLF